MTTAAAHHVGAVPIDAVVCPPWCIISQEERLRELPHWEGGAIHGSAQAEGEGRSLRYAAVTYANGEPDPTSEPGLFITTRETISADAALQLASAIKATCEGASDADDRRAQDPCPPVRAVV